MMTQKKFVMADLEVQQSNKFWNRHRRMPIFLLFNGIKRDIINWLKNLYSFYEKGNGLCGELIRKCAKCVAEFLKK